MSARSKTVLLRRSDGAVACERCHVAATPLLRMRGLLGWRNLPSGEGMLLRPAPSIQTFFMSFPIDAVFLDRDGKVLKVRSNVAPWRLAGCRGAHATLELAAGEAERRGIRAGEQLEVVEGSTNGSNGSG